MNENEKYKIAYRQVLEILKYLPAESYSKIPKKFIKMLKSNINYNYNFSYNPNKNYEEQNVLPETIEILNIINEKYL